MRQNEGDWKETVRDIFDYLLVSAPPRDPVRQYVLGLIEARHYDYFCGRDRGDGE
jgi:hypothetical protein